MRHVGIIGGSAALSHAGWTTQFQQMPDILIPVASPEIEIPGARLHRRPEPIYRILEEHSEAGPGAEWECLMLDPAHAIADAWLDRARGGKTHLYDPDDIEPECDDFTLRLREALINLRASDEEAEACLRHLSAVGHISPFKYP